MQALSDEGHSITQATLSRDLKQLKVAKAATIDGKYVYVLPNETMYHRVSSSRANGEATGCLSFLSVTFSGNIGVIKTRPGHAGCIAYNIDNTDIPQILGTVAGDDTILIIISEDAKREEVERKLRSIVPSRNE